MGTYIVPNTYDDVILGADQNDRGLWGLERDCLVKVDFQACAVTVVSGMHA